MSYEVRGPQIGDYVYVLARDEWGYITRFADGGYVNVHPRGRRQAPWKVLISDLVLYRRDGNEFVQTEVPAAKPGLVVTFVKHLMPKTIKINLGIGVGSILSVDVATLEFIWGTKDAKDEPT